MAYYNAGSEVNASNTADLIDEDEIVDDLSILPLDKDSFAICELCGRIGRRTHFYPRNNKFCSLRCHASRTRRKHCSWRFKLMEGVENMEGLIPLEPLPQLQQWHATLNDIQAGPIKQPAAQVANSYEWKDELFGCDFLAAPVSLFKHAPLHDMWDNTFEGMKVEVKNTDCDNYSEKLNDFFWVATVLKVKGYMGLLRYEGFGSDDSKDFWVNLCCSEVHPVGWCATRGKPLIPPRSIEDKYTDWKKFLVKQLTGARTLPANFYTKLHDSLKSRFSIGSVMEVVDKNRISQVKVASVVEIIGKRLHVKYYDSSPEDNGFWCHEDSPLIHPAGWAFRVGHALAAPHGYCHRVATARLTPLDATPDMFYKYPTNEPPLFAEGMKLEAIDPLNLSAVCAATVMQILNEGYMMIRIDCYPADASGADWFCYHQRSPCIFPVGFALANNIPLVPPAGYTMEEFNWESYLMSCGGRAAPRALFAARGHLVSHGFVCGMRLECADLMDPRLVCVATVARVVADLLKVHFDGWGSEYDQWLWAHSTDMYPVGWCRAVAHRLEGPVPPPPRARKPARARRRRRLGQKVQPQPPNMTEDSSQNSDMADTKSLSPPTSVSEISPDVESRHDDTESRPDDTESRPDDTESRPDDTESRPDDTESRPDDTESRPDDTESRPDDAELRPDDTESRPDDIELRPDESESRPDDTFTRPDDTFPRPDDTFTRPDDTFPQPDDTFTRPDDTFTRPKDTFTRPDDAFTRPDDTFTRPDDTFTRPDDTFTRPDDTFTRPDDTFTRPDDTFTRPDDTFTRPDDTFTRSDDTFTRPDDTFTRPDDTFTRSDDTFTRPDDTFTRPDDTFTRPDDTFTRPDDTFTRSDESTADDGERPDDKMEVEEAADDTSQERPSDETNQESTSTPPDAAPEPASCRPAAGAAAAVPPDPLAWTPADVARFLALNECRPYAPHFAHVAGAALLRLTKDEIVALLGMKVGPALKIYDLIQQLKCKVKQPQCRLHFQ